MNESRPSVARRNTAARRNYLILSVIAVAFTTTGVVAAFLMYE